MRKTNEASLFSYNGESINEGEQRKAAVAVAVAVAAVVTVELQTFLMAVELYLCIVNGDLAPTRRPYRKYMSRRKSFPAAMILSSMDRSNRHSAAVLANLLRPQRTGGDGGRPQDSAPHKSSLPTMSEIPKRARPCQLA